MRLLLLLLLRLHSGKLGTLCRDPLLPPLTCSLGLGALGVHLVLDDAGTLCFGFGLVDLVIVELESTKRLKG